MNKKERFGVFLRHYPDKLPEENTELHYSNAYELLVAVVLSAQCKDERINQVTPALFRDFPGPAYLATSTFDELYPYIKSVSYPNNKTKHLLGLGRMMVEEFDTKVPAAIHDLQKLPGVGRKTANLVAATIYNTPALAVDTHVFRVSQRLGLITQTAKTPLDAEKQLLRYIPSEHVNDAQQWLVLHGRYVCLARKPKCQECDATHFCRFFEKNLV